MEENNNNLSLPQIPVQPSDPIQADLSSSGQQTSAGDPRIMAVPEPIQSFTQIAATDDSSMGDATDGLTAEDVDLIEKAWVEKAKAIVRSTQGDPYKQNRELSKVKADYIKKRYSRDIKVTE